MVKVHLQHVFTATALNFARMSAWLSEAPRAQTRQAAFVRLVKKGASMDELLMSPAVSERMENLGLLLPFPQVLLLPLPTLLPLTRWFRLPHLWQQAKPRPHSTRWIGQRPTGHRTGRGLPFRMGFLVPHFSPNPMGRCAARQAIHCVCTNVGQNATAPCVCCMLPALAIAAPVRCASSVKKRTRRSHRDG